MSYCIAYNPELNRKYPKRKYIKQFPIKKLLFLTMILVTSYVFLQAKLYRYFIPGDPDVTVPAFSTMVDRVGDGDSVRDALVEFCKEIIMNGN